MSKLAVIGAGIVGQATGKGFIGNRHDVIFCDINPEVLARLENKGHRVCLYPFLRSVTMFSGDDRACLSFELLAGNIAPILHHSPIAGYAFERANTNRLAVGFFFLFSLLSFRKRKTDKVDSQNLAFLASQNYGYRFIETEAMAKSKAMVRHYWKLRQSATDHLRHDRYMKEYRGINDESVSKFMIKRCEVLKKIIVKEWSKGNDVKYLVSIPGITPFLAATILAELLPLERFKTIDQIVAFSGLDPSVKQTGGKAGHHGHISKRGSPTLREALFLAAFGSFQHDPMKSIYVRYKARGLHHNTILCILGRKILRIAISLLKKRRVFDASKLSTDDDLTGT